MGDVDDNVADIAWARQLGFGRKPNKGIDLALDEELGLANRWIRDPGHFRPTLFGAGRSRWNLHFGDVVAT